MRLPFGAARSSALSITAALLLLFASGAVALPRPAVAQADSASTQKKVSIELTTDPSPAHKGPNTVRVKLTDEAGQPISGAEVTVTFFMPAMPEMGMAAIKTVIKGADKGGGIYEGKDDLSSGGLWQVTVTERQNGQVIASKKLTVKATGGM